MSQRPYRSRLAKMSPSASTGVPASWPIPRAILTGKPAFAAKTSIIRNQKQSSKMSARPATCPWPAMKQKWRATKAKSSRIFLLLMIPRKMPRLKTACHVRFAIRSARKNSAHGRVLMAASSSILRVRKTSIRNTVPISIENGQAHIMQTSSEGFRPTGDTHIQDSALCATCHTLYTRSLAPGGQDLGLFPEQVPFLEWQHSSYANKNSCQSCHMPEIQEDVPISGVLGVASKWRARAHLCRRKLFHAENVEPASRRFKRCRHASRAEREAQRTIDFLQSKSVRLSIRNVEVASSQLQLDVFVENLTGHKFPTAYPSRRAWLHVVVRDRNGHTAFESGALRPDGSIEGNDNDADPARFEPHYREIKTPRPGADLRADPERPERPCHHRTFQCRGIFEGQSSVTRRISKNKPRNKILPSLETPRTIRILQTRET